MADTPEEVVRNVDVAGAQPIISVNTDDPAEVKARESGWVTLEEWDGDPADWVDARNYNLRGELMRRIQSQSKQLIEKEERLKKLDNAVKSLGEHNRKIAEVQYEKAMRDLKAQRREALNSGDDEVVDAVEDRIDQLKTAKKEMESQAASEEMTPEQQAPPADFQVAFEGFIEENSWYKDDRIMRAAADVIGQSLFEEGKSAEEVFKGISKQIKQEFPHKFNSHVRNGSAVDDPPAVPAKGGTRQGGKSKHTQKDLTPGELEVARTLVDSGAFKTMQEYVDQFEQIGGFEGERL